MKVNLGKYPKGASKRRINIEIEDFDTWSLDHTLALIILPALIQLRQTKQGVPSEFVDYIGNDLDRNYQFDFIRDDSDKVFDECCKKWDEVLDKIIWSFQQLSIDDDYDSKYHHGKMEIGWEKIPDDTYPNAITKRNEPLYQMVDKNPSEHWYDHAGHTIHDERIREGFELFGKYYRNLWD